MWFTLVLPNMLCLNKTEHPVETSTLSEEYLYHKWRSKNFKREVCNFAEIMRRVMYGRIDLTVVKSFTPRISELYAGVELNLNSRLTAANLAEADSHIFIWNDCFVFRNNVDNFVERLDAAFHGQIAHRYARIELRSFDICRLCTPTELLSFCLTPSPTIRFVVSWKLGEQANAAQNRSTEKFDFYWRHISFFTFSGKEEAHCCHTHTHIHTDSCTYIHMKTNRNMPI